MLSPSRSSLAPSTRSALDRALVAYPRLSRLRLELRLCRERYALLLNELSEISEAAKARDQRVKLLIANTILEEAGGLG